MSIAAGLAAIMYQTIGEPQHFIDRMTVMAVMIVAGCLEGLAIGYFQWRILRRVFKQLTARAWLVPTIIVAAIGWFFGMLQPTFFAGDELTASSTPTVEPSIMFVALFAAGFGILAGTFFGFAQWLPLRVHAQRAWIWIPFNSIGWAIALAIIYLGATIPDPKWSFGKVIMTGTVTGILAGIAIGAVTGIGLLWIYSKPTHPTRNE